MLFRVEWLRASEQRSVPLRADIQAHLSVHQFMGGLIGQGLNGPVDQLPVGRRDHAPRAPTRRLSPSHCWTQKPRP